MNKEELSKIVNMLERQIPSKPDMYGDGYDDDGNMIYDTYDCPNCNTNYEIDYDGKHKFCPECGQAIDWSAVENGKD